MRQSVAKKFYGLPAGLSRGALRGWSALTGDFSMASILLTSTSVSTVVVDPLLVPLVVVAFLNFLLFSVFFSVSLVVRSFIVLCIRYVLPFCTSFAS